MIPTLHTTVEVRKLVPDEKIQKLSKVNDFIGLLSVAFEWILIVGTVILFEQYFSWYFYPLIVIFLGARYLALGLLMHDAVHRLLSKSRPINDWIAEIFCAWPVLVSMRSYRIKHLAHHARLNTNDDPDHIAKADPNWQYPMKRAKFFKIMLTQISGMGVFETLKVMSSKQMKLKKKKTPLWYHLARIAFYLVMLFGFIFSGNGMILFLYWLIPFFTWTQFANRLRRIAEHSGIDHKSHDLQTRTTTHGFLARIFLSPKFISYHNEHHIYPAIPYYNLRKVHRLLNENEILKENLHTSNSYMDVYKECIITD